MATWASPRDRYVGQPRVRMLMEACELDARHPAKTDDIALPAGLSIEHVFRGPGTSTGRCLKAQTESSSALTAKPN